MFNDPTTSYGHRVNSFARDVLGTPLDPWEEHAVIRLGELKTDNRTPRGRKVLIVVGRQNGKTFLTRVLTMYWLAMDCWPMTFGISTTAAMAKKQWEKACRFYETDPTFRPDLRRIVRATGFETLETVDGAEYCFGAANENAGRSLAIDRLIIDELRNHKTWGAWNASYKAMNGRPRGQAVCITNQGDLRSVVLRSLRAAALKDIEEGRDDGDTLLLEWSADGEDSPLDVNALAKANPNMNRVGWDGELRMDQGSLLEEGKRALLAGGEELAVHRIEVLCQEQSAIDAAVDPVAWRAGNRESWPQKRSRVVAFLDMNPDAAAVRHITLCTAAVLVDDRIVVAVRKEWSGPDAEATMRAELRGLLAEMRPAKLGWVPLGPGGALRAYMGNLRVPGMEVEAVEGTEVSQMCMQFSARVLADEVIHLHDPELEKHVTRAAKYYSGKLWRFTGGEGIDVDGAYAAAGAVHLALGLPKPVRAKISAVPN